MRRRNRLSGGVLLLQPGVALGGTAQGLFGCWDLGLATGEFRSMRAGTEGAVSMI
ncbi:hypothetical protein F0726_01601 [Acidithiobacillus caldus]|nr:hypothetical protein F0726_01601 [Acidithiobacillus caldus]